MNKKAYHYGNIPGLLLQLPAILQIQSSALTLLAAFVFSKFVKGWSNVTYPHALCTFFTILLILNGYSSKLLYALSILFWIIHAAFVVFFHYHHFPKPFGRFLSGYQFIQNPNLTYSVFYPTDDVTKPLAKLVEQPLSLNKHFQIVRFLHWQKKRFLYDVSYDYLTKLRINAHEGAKLISADNPMFDMPGNKFVPVIFTHGLSTNHNSYSVICTELASQGYIVLSLDHDDPVSKIVGMPGNPVQMQQLEKRVGQIKELITNLHDEAFLEKLFGQKISLALDQLTIIGHSYGGCTAQLATLRDNRIKNTILLDPLTYPLTKEQRETKVNTNLLVLECESWDKGMPFLNVRKNNQTIFKAQSNNGKIALHLILPRTDHCSFIDNCLFCGPDQVLLKEIKYFSEVVDKINLIKTLTAKFIMTVTESQEKDSNVSAKKYLEEYSKDQVIVYEGN